MSSSGGSRGASAPLTLVAGAAGNVAIAVKINSADANPTLMIRGDGMIQFGPGGASALDGSLSRSGVPDIGVTGLLVAGPGGAGDYGFGLLGRSTFKQSGNSFPTLTVENAAGNPTGGTLQTTGAIETGLGFGLTPKEGANAKQNTIGAMTAGSITVANTSVTASSRIFPMRGPGGTNPGAWYVSAIVAGTSFTVASTNAADTGTGWYTIQEPGT